MRVLPMPLLLATHLALSGCATSNVKWPTSTRPAMAIGATVDAPAGFKAFCERNLESCIGHHSTANYSEIGDDAMMSLLKRINEMVNGGVRQVPDQTEYGVAEYWRRSGVGFGATGDCEDLAIEKRERLLAAGVSPERLYYATAYRRGLGLHAVLIAATTHGELVLDSRTPYLHRWNDVPYIWVSRQSRTDPRQWSMVIDQLAPKRAPKSGPRSQSASTLPTSASS